MRWHRKQNLKIPIETYACVYFNRCRRLKIQSLNCYILIFFPSPCLHWHFAGKRGINILVQQKFPKGTKEVVRKRTDSDPCYFCCKLFNKYTLHLIWECFWRVVFWKMVLRCRVPGAYGIRKGSLILSKALVLILFFIHIQITWDSGPELYLYNF